MKRKIWFTSFLLLALSILYLMSLYIMAFFYVAYDTLTWTVFLDALWLFILPFTYIVGELLMRKTGIGLIKGIGGYFLGTLSIFVSTVTIGFVLLPFFPSHTLGHVIFLSGLVLSIFALINHFLPPHITKLNLDIGLGKKLKLVQLTDIHINGLKPLFLIKNIVKKTNALNPDIICFTGDLIDVDPKWIGPHLNELKKLTAKLGKVAVSGNHDFYSEYQIYKSVLNDLGFQLIDNTLTKIDDLQFAGIPDKDSARFGETQKNIAHLLSFRDKNKPLVFLNHRPENFEDAVENGADLHLSGHTHWGQLPPWGILTKLSFTYASGLNDYKSSAIYTGKGTSTWGPPMRLFGRSEIVEITVY